MLNQKKISGKIINYNSSITGSIFFDDIIQDIEEHNLLDCDKIIIPGFVDLHCHGGNGFDVMDGSEAIVNMSKYHLEHGTTSLMPTTWTNTLVETFSALKGFKEIQLLNKNLLGVHLEGPFINPDKLGAQPNLTIKPSIEFIEKIKQVADIKIITLAPEIQGMYDFIKYLVKFNIKIQFGHTLANMNSCQKIMDEFEVGFTHLYNAMSGNDHRKPGVLSAALSNGEHAEIICDNIHVSKQAIRIAKKCITGLYAITDSINASGLKDGDYIFAKNKINKLNNSVKIIDDGTLAGSIITMDKTFKNLIEMGFTDQEAVELTSYNASRYIRENNIGKLDIGFRSNILVLDKDYNLLEVYLDGVKINA